MRANLLDKIPTIVAIISAYYIGAAVIYNIGFFGVFGLDNITLLTIADYLQSGITLIPYTIYFIVLGFFGCKLTNWVCTKLPLKLLWLIDKPKAIIILLFIIVSVLTVCFWGWIILTELKDSVILSDTVPDSAHKVALDGSSFVSVFLNPAIFIFAVYIFYGSDWAQKLPVELRLMIAILPFSFYLPFDKGVSDARDKRDNKANVEFYINEEIQKDAVVLRHLERGVLLYSNQTSSMKLVAWSNIKNIAYTPVATEKNKLAK